MSFDPGILGADRGGGSQAHPLEAGGLGSSPLQQEQSRPGGGEDAVRNAEKDGPAATLFWERDRSEFAARCSAVANRVCGGPPKRCWGWKAQIWQAAWDAARDSSAGDPKDFLT